MGIFSATRMCWMLAGLLVTLSLRAGEASPAGQPRVYTDAAAGYSFVVPAGYDRLSEEENHEVFEGLSKVFGKEASERTQRQPPAWFKGPVDPARPKALPPSLAVSFSSMDQPIDPAELPKYKESLIANFKRRDIRSSDPELSIIQVAGASALRVEHDIFSPIDNSRAQEILISIPGNGRRCEIVFQFSPAQAEGVQQALKTVLDSFKLQTPALLESADRQKWSRVIYWTAGSGLAGVLLYVLIGWAAGAIKKKRTPPQAA